MYFERWGLLASPPGKVSFLKNILALLFPHGYYTSPIASVQHAAYWRAGVQETVPLSNYTKISSESKIIYKLPNRIQKQAKVSFIPHVAQVC
jgi:hypothetical protein